MTHLRIEQNNGITEQVTSDIISKLYTVAYNSVLDGTSNLIGRLSTTAAYADEAAWLTEHFTDLYINADKYYVKFEDPAAQQICVTNYSSDGVGCSVQDLAAVTYMDNTTYGANCQITSFNEFRYFTGIANIGEIFATGVQADANTALQYITLPDTITKIGRLSAYGGGFIYCSGLREITIPNNCTVGQASFRYCTGLTRVTFGNGSVIENIAFDSCSNLSTLDLGKCTEMYTECFTNCSSLTSVTIPNTVTYIGNAVFMNCNLSSITFESGGTSPLTLEGGTTGWMPGTFKLAIAANGNKTIYLPERLSELKNNALQNNGGYKFVFASTTPPSVTGNGSLGDITGGTIYVPDAALSAYQAAAGFSSVSSQIKGISELT